MGESKLAVSELVHPFTSVALAIRRWKNWAEAKSLPGKRRIGREKWSKGEGRREGRGGPSFSGPRGRSRFEIKDGRSLLPSDKRSIE